MPTMVSYVCEHCGSSFERRKGYGGPGRFCSRSCTASGTQAGWNRTDITKVCESCQQEYRVRPNELDVRRTCSKKCLGTLQSRERRGSFQIGAANPNFDSGQSPRHYRRFLGEKCDWCGSTSHLLIHHRDENRRNNHPDNLATLCKKCHQAHHASRDEETGRYITSP